MRAAGEQFVQDSAAGDITPTAADKQPATTIVAGARGLPHTAAQSRLRLRVVVPWTMFPR